MLKKIILTCFFLSLSVFAQTHALLIGSNNGNLIGAENDARAMAQLLRNKNINISQVLYGSHATKRNILNAFKNIVKQAKAKDWVYLFFSGHGRSHFDPAIQNKPKLIKRLQNTGALLSADNQLIVIKESLAPLFRILDKRGVRTILIFDACFSGMAYKDIFNQSPNLAFYTPTPTRRGTYPYKHLIYLSSTTGSDFASESSVHKRGYFSMAITHCLAKNHHRNNINSCLNKIKYKNKKLPQKPIILPKHNFSVFPSYTKDIGISPTYFSLKEELFNLAKASKDFELYTLNKYKLTSKNYRKNEKLTVYLNSKKSGYFVFFMMGESNKLYMKYPNNKKLPYIKSKTHKRILSITAKEPFGEECLGAFLVDRSSVLKLQKLYVKTNGHLIEEHDIKESMKIIEEGYIEGAKLSLISSKK